MSKIKNTPVANMTAVEGPVVVTATELKQNLSKYLKIAQSREVLITKNGKTVNKLANMREERWRKMQEIFGVVKGLEHATDEEVDAMLDDIRYERIKEKCGY